MSWDGSHLGAGVVLTNWKAPHGETLSRGEVGAGVLLGYLCGKDACFSAFVEAIKPLFGLGQRGHHLLTVGGREHVLYHAHSEVEGGKRRVREFSLSSVARDDPLRARPETAEAVRRILAFREVCLLYPVDERAVLVRVVPDGHSFLSIRESKQCANEERHRLSQKTFRTWFGDRSQAEQLREAFGDDQHSNYRLGCALDEHVSAHGARFSEYRYRICKRVALQTQN